MSTYEKGDTIQIPVTFTDPNTGEEAPSVPDAAIEIFKGNAQMLASTPLVLISGGKFFYEYTIPLTAISGVYTAYVTGTVGAVLQTATLSFSVTDRMTTLQNTVDAVKLDIQDNKIDADNQFNEIKQDIGDPSSDGTNLHQELQTIISDLGDPLTTGQDITQKLDDIRVAIGLGTPVGIVTCTGIVIDSNGSPLFNVRVIAVSTSTGNAFDTNITQTNGAYTLHLNPGNYVLQFVQSTTVLRQTLELVVPIGITTLTIPNVSLAIKKTVSDVIQDTDHNPIPGVLVKAILESNYDPNVADNRVESAAYSNDSGIFTLDLFPGIYMFQFIKTGYDALPQRKIVA